MKAFAELYRRLEYARSPEKKAELLMRFLENAKDDDKLWAIAIFSGKKVRSGVSVNLLREFALQVSEIEEWLFDECYARVGDLAETISLILPAPNQEHGRTLAETLRLMREVEKAEVEEKCKVVVGAWDAMETFERFVFNRLLTAGLRQRLPRKIICKAVAMHTGISEKTIAHRLSGEWTPYRISYEELVLTPHADEHLSTPYPFCKAEKLPADPDALGEAGDWLAEWKWEGIRGQLIKRGGKVYLWSKEGELVTDKFPEIDSSMANWPDGTVIDGEIMGFREGRPMTLLQLQSRLNRKNIDKKVLQEIPAVFMAFDLLEDNGADVRQLPLIERRKRLSKLLDKCQGEALMLSEVVPFKSWKQLRETRRSGIALGSEGLMLKRAACFYESGSWFKWKFEQHTIDAVLIYAQAGPRSGAAKYSEYTFGLWSGELLVPVAKAITGLSNAEVREIDEFVRNNTKEKFGPVRSITAELVFEIAFEAVEFSTRHKSGVTVRAPKILKWKTAAKPEEAHSLDDLKKMIR
ncbi:MAG: ATP-dependent DNA ligase [Bacteroidia bacterium]